MTPSPPTEAGRRAGPKPIIAVTISSPELPKLVHWRRMFEGLYYCGAIPLAIDCGTAALPISRLLEHVDGLLLSGGVDVEPTRYGADRNDPSIGPVNATRDSNEIAAFESAWRRQIPTLAICRGAQLVNTARGGSLYADLPRDHPSEIAHRRTEDDLVSIAHDIGVEAGSRIAKWLDREGRIAVNSQHHQGIRVLASAFVATAYADDGLIEAYEAVHQPLTAIQWHPEIDWENNEMSRRILRGFIDSCTSVRDRTPETP
ncbi:gamma-glutamyl-gamma-aminobutyrate hydrolase family protein [Mycolicibacterium helvum]|uniref:Gamma-glutamyl-gamma-aminobutyrate hydrolase n=1 Tax=Mycolicibacterium helvum TaxID=1534349 RepID=A0A7I7TEN9_9MYCO|nr:gamma-glutamyl-gamma-aminobutyrate hydrolase family protein [Mycolicibacterium helvum]BBY67480.1 gamma-glutamyl-gamma-aminobutyrate hydrolase [Mycolicibacterium helvum]